MIYGFRISVLFGLVLTIVSTVIGVLAGAVQGFYGGWVDLLFQRFLEIWGGLPFLYVLLILSSVIEPGFWTLLGIMLLVSWTWPVGVVRAEFLRARNFEYVRAAKALGMSDWRIMTKHILPNALVATLTFLPFTLSGSVTTLTALDFLGLGLPPGSPSLGELLQQGKENLQAPWLGITGFVVIGGMLTLLIFIGEGDPRRLRSQEDHRMSGPDANAPLLKVENLSVAFRGRVVAEDISFAIERGETLALVGESGSGKSVTALSILKLLPYPAASHPSGRILFQGEDLMTAPPERACARCAAARSAMIFQEPMTSLNPLHRIERQLVETLTLHRDLPREAARKEALELLKLVQHPRCREAHERVPARAVRRPAPARDDRHGARQQARPADRRRADHRASTSPSRRRS